MARKKISVQYKHTPISVSLPPAQHWFLEKNKTFNLSKFVQIHLQEEINFRKILEQLKGGKNDDKRIKRNRKRIY